MSGKKLTEADMGTIRSALNHAMDERASYADAWSNRGPEAKKALASVRRYERLYAKLFGGKSDRQQHLDADAAAPRVSILELMKGPRP